MKNIKLFDSFFGIFDKKYIYSFIVKSSGKKGKAKMVGYNIEEEDVKEYIQTQLAEKGIGVKLNDILITDIEQVKKF